MKHTDLVELVRAVLAKVAAYPWTEESGGYRTVYKAVTEVAQERGIFREDFRELTLAAERRAAERVGLAASNQKPGNAESLESRRERRALLLDLADAELVNISVSPSTLFAAREHYREAVLLFDRESEPVAWAEAQEKFGAVLWSSNNPEFAELWGLLLSERKRQIGKEDAKTVRMMHEVAIVRCWYDTKQNAKSSYGRALEASERVFGPDHPTTLGIVKDFAELILQRADYWQAEPLYRRLLAVRERQLGLEHPDTLDIVQALADLHYSTGRYPEAELLYRRSLEGNERALGVEHGKTCVLAYNLARFLEKRGLKEDAKPLAWQAYRGWLKNRGVDHEETKFAFDLLTRLGEQPGR